MLNLYRETPFQVKPCTPSSVISFQIPAHDGTYHRSKYTAASNSADEQFKAAKDERSFASQHLSSQSSIYFRQSKAYPRSFLWRVVNEDRVLQIQCADLTRSEHDQKEAHLTLYFEFQDAILPSGVALADPENVDLLNVFVITTRKELHTLSLPTEYFRDSKASAVDVRQWSKTSVPSTFTIDHPHRLLANTPFELFVSFDSGRLQRLTRTADNMGTDWVQDNYDDRTWGSSFRGIIGRRGAKMARFGQRQLDPLTVHAMVASPDSTHVYTVCIDHTLRVWNLTTGRLVVSKDLLDQSRQPHDNLQLNPAEPSFIRLCRPGLAGHPILLTYSHHEGGQFKFWNVRGGLTDPISIEDRFPGLQLSPPDPDPSGNTIWSLTAFDIKPGNTDNPSELWVLWRNNNYHQLYSVHFDLQTLPEAWETNWVKVAVDLPTKGNPPDYLKSDPCDSTEKWMEYLFWPERFPLRVLETALSIYQDATFTKSSLPQKDASLQERLSLTIASSATLRKQSDSEMDYERFTADVYAQWRNFWRIVETINETRQAPVALAIDSFADISWIAMADQFCVVRDSSDTELLTQNGNEDLQDLERLSSGLWPHRKVGANSAEPLHRMSSLLRAAVKFREQFSPELERDIRVALDEEMFQDAELPVSSRIDNFYEQCNFSEAISNETYEQLMGALDEISGGAKLDVELVFALLDTLPEKLRQPKSALRSTLFGSNILVSGLQDSVFEGRQLVHDLLVLLVFLEGENNQEGSQETDYETSKLFSQLLTLMKEYEKNVWLISHVRLAPLEFLGLDAAPNAVRTHVNLSPKDSLVVSILYDTVGKDIRPQPAIDKPQSFLLTETLAEIESWLAGADEISPADGIVYIQCNLIAQNNIDLATDFLRFQPKTAWATYVKGRLHLARSEFDLAANYFQKAAYALACGRAVGALNEMSAGLLSMVDVQYFNNGLPRYFEHVLALFEASRSFAHVADFARLALQSLPPGQKEPTVAFRSEVLSRLFTAELKCSRWLHAFTALSQFTDLALQKSSLLALFEGVVASNSGTSGTIGAFQLLQKLPLGLYPHLSRHLDQHLGGLAKKQSFIPAVIGHSWSGESDTDHLKILQALRTTQKDYRGAVAVLFDRLQLIKKSNRARNDPQAVQIRQCLLALINALNCVAPDEAYLITEVESTAKANGEVHHRRSDSSTSASHPASRKRIIVTLEDLRREYQQLLDKCSRIERDDFDFEMEDDESEEEEDFRGANGTNSRDRMEV